MGKRDNRKKKGRGAKAAARLEKAFADDDKQVRKKSKLAVDSSDDDEDLEAILESFKAEVTCEAK